MAALKQEWADLITIDLSSDSDHAADLHQAMTTRGFFALVGHGISEEEIKRQVDLGYVRGSRVR